MMPTLQNREENLKIIWPQNNGCKTSGIFLPDISAQYVIHQSHLECKESEYLRTRPGSQPSTHPPTTSNSY